MNVLHRLSPYRFLLYAADVIGFFGLNGVFLFYLPLRPDVMTAALQNPIGLVFILEAFLMTGFVAWLISRLGLQKPVWPTFVALSVVGSIAFSVPAFLLLHLRQHDERKRDASTSHTAAP